MTETVMWEARAASGRVDDLVAWVLEHAPAQANVYRGGEERVVVIDPSGGSWPDPPADLLARAAHRWSFTAVPR
jgi:hypothetical protein